MQSFASVRNGAAQAGTAVPTSRECLCIAIRFSNRGQILVQALVEQDDGHSLLLRLEVSDKGIGLTAEQQTRLFRVFSQVDGSPTCKYGGSGLGPAISMRLAKLMGGDVGVASEVGVASAFWMTARLKRANDVQSPIGSNMDSLREVLVHRFQGLRVLVAEDDPVSQAVACGLLVDAGLLVDMAGVEVHRRNVTDWLDWMGLIDAGAAAKLDHYIGYYGPCFDSHVALDADQAVREEARNVARSVVQAVKEQRAGRLSQPDKLTKAPRTK